MLNISDNNRAPCCLPLWKDGEIGSGNEAHGELIGPSLCSVHQSWQCSALIFRIGMRPTKLNETRMARIAKIKCQIS